jgi:predicted kinase
MEEAIIQLKSYLQETKQPLAITLVGLPLSGKDTLIERLGLTNIKILSRDTLIESLFPKTTYREAYSAIDSKTVDKLFFKQLEEAVSKKESVLINATNLRVKRRRKINLRLSSDYLKLAIQLPEISIEEFEQRNQSRVETTGKYIPIKVVEEMKGLFEPVTEEEGFDQIFRF